MFEKFKEKLKSWFTSSKEKIEEEAEIVETQEEIEERADKIIEKAKDVYQSKFDGTFYVLIHPYRKDDPVTQDLIKLLEENDINILYHPIDYSKEYQIPGDISRHPTAEFNKILANLIAEDLELVNEEN